MTELRAQCRWESGDYFTAFRAGDALHFDAYSDNQHGASVVLRPEPARTFARGILALADEIDGGEATRATAHPKVGDRVRIVRNAFDFEGDENIGATGTLLAIDPDEQPYKVNVDGYGVWWAAEVASVDERPALAEPTSYPFAARVEEAKRLLTGTTHTGYDVIALARELHENA